ncbi:MAG: di-trans,poly-cis-decaprenylcistransferase [Chloroflexi bacterium]|nr:di-trans,poly-cis-decaprenylcistransferase [Chloroflexota bacterium]
MVVAPVPQDRQLVELAKLPQHVAIIMDGNGRWAQQNNVSRQAGHRAGAENIRRVIETFAMYEVPVLTLFAFSTENWVRPRREVNALIRLIGHFIDRELQQLHENGVRLHHMGSLDPLSADLRNRVEEAMELTKDNDRITVNVAFNYGGRMEILEAVRHIIEDGVPADRIDEELFATYLDTDGLPDTDLVIRTAGEQRLSNFLLWQTAYAEYYTTPVYWPDFNVDEIERALIEFSHRQRRFGGVGEAQADPPRSPKQTG